MAKMRIIIKICVMIISTIGGIFLALILFSLLFPNTLPVVDTTIRLPVQSRLMASISHVAIRELALDDNYNIITDTTESLSWKDIQPYIAQLEPGDIFFTDSRYVSSFFIPGNRQHSVIYIGDRDTVADIFGTGSKIYSTLAPYYTNDMEKLIIDSSSDGVHVRNLAEVANLKNISYLKSLIGFRINTDTANHEKFLSYALQNLGKKYDYDMITEDQSSLYCSELLYHALKKIGIKLKIMSSVVGRLVVSPNDAVDFIVQQGIVNKDFKLLFFIGKQEGSVISFVDTIEKTSVQ